MNSFSLVYQLVRWLSMHVGGHRSFSLCCISGCLVRPRESVYDLLLEASRQAKHLPGKTRSRVYLHPAFRTTPISCQSSPSLLHRSGSMTLFRLLALGAVILPFVSALPSHAPVDLSFRNSVKRQYGPPAYDAPVDRAQGVIDTFRVAWEGYYQYAFPNDELKPVTNGFSNSR